MKYSVLLIGVIVLVGCGPKTWESVSPPDIRGPSGLTSVSSFVASNGWNMYTNEGGIGWEDLEPKSYIRNLPWSTWTNQQFQALTRDGVLYVLLDPGWHHDYSGVAFNPKTNRFPECIRGFKPVGGHWYLWAQPEFQSVEVDGRYE